MNIQWRKSKQSHSGNIRLKFTKLSIPNEQLELILQEQKNQFGKASDKLIDNISFHKSANKLMSGSLKDN
jgi:hypothetical protein